ncbi:hypothetical protein JR316_0009039 [Psilocybe cubensis]|uniref:Uncharacterized protein n=2 Tax=Psilocybe cubensis TaxID=181762 RepID=A0ACB8GT23_PSICU|nr:hypothetical protein JR316_0009039 [Psilocybe cubensis]KAH9478582.1 hypothetical protein JR316_0009039 [Psilocybe cubensis]
MDNDAYQNFYISFPGPSSENNPSQLSGVSFVTQYPSPVASESTNSQHAENSNEVVGHLDQADNNTVVSLSTCFYPKGDPETDTVFMSSDNVYFYANYKTIVEAEPNAFLPCIVAPLSDQRYRSSVIYLDAPSPELNVILHALYKTSPATNSPTFEVLVRAIDRMPRYGLLAETLIASGTPIYELLLSHAPLYPLDAYALAAHHGIAALASTVSTHLLSHDMRTISDDMAERIGPIYLKRLLLLHTNRFRALKDILLRAPIPHPETPECSFTAQKKVTRAWALVSAYLVWDVKPDTSTHTLSQSLNPLLDHVTCKECEKILKDKIKEVMVRWTAVKVGN